MNINLRQNFSVQPGFSLAGARTALKAKPKEALREIQALIKTGKLGLRTITSLQAFFDAFSDVEVPVFQGHGEGRRSIMSSAFPILTGSMVTQMLMDTLAAEPSVGDSLVEEINAYEANTKIMAILVEAKSAVATVKEGDPYPEVGAGEEEWEVGERPNGRRISITKKAIERNQINNIIGKINALARVYAKIREDLIIDRVTDRYGSAVSPAAPYTGKFRGANTSLYTTSTSALSRAPSGTRVTNNDLTDEENLARCWTVLSSIVDELGQKIARPHAGLQLLVPTTRYLRALKLVRSAGAISSVNEVNNWGPDGEFKVDVIQSGRLDAMGAAGLSAWYMGYFKRQYVLKNATALETVTMGADTESYLQRGIAYQARMSWDIEVGARGYGDVIQNLAGTTIPV